MKANISRYIATLALALVWGFATEVGYGQTKVPLVKPVAAPPVPVNSIRQLPTDDAAAGAEAIRPASHAVQETPHAAVPVIQAVDRLAPIAPGSNSTLPSTAPPIMRAPIRSSGPMQPGSAMNAGAGSSLVPLVSSPTVRSESSPRGSAAQSNRPSSVLAPALEASAGRRVSEVPIARPDSLVPVSPGTSAQPTSQPPVLRAATRVPSSAVIRSEGAVAGAMPENQMNQRGATPAMDGPAMNSSSPVPPAPRISVPVGTSDQRSQWSTASQSSPTGNRAADESVASAPGRDLAAPPAMPISALRAEEGMPVSTGSARGIESDSVEPSRGGEAQTPPDYSFYLGRRDSAPQVETSQTERPRPTGSIRPATSPNVLPTENYLDGSNQELINWEMNSLDPRSRLPGRPINYRQDGDVVLPGERAGEGTGNVVVEPQPAGQNAVGAAPHSSGDCPNCGGTGCSQCGMLSGDWSETIGNDYHNFDDRFDNCGFVPGASEYAILDVLYWTRNQGGIVGTNFGGVRGYDYDFGGRLTLGQRPDRIHGREFTYFGIVPLEQETSQFNAGANINARFVPADGLGAFQTSAFFNARETTQRTETEFHSVAFDRTRYGWDIVKTNIGLRYLYLDDKYSLRSENFLGHEGLMGIAGRNHLFGGNVGLDMFYDVGRRVSFSWFGKLGGYLNANRTSLDFFNRGTQFIANRDSSAQFAASIDLGVNAHYHLSNNARFRVGYSGLWVTGVTTAGANYPRFLTPLSGLSADDESDVFFHGLNLGLEVFW